MTIKRWLILGIIAVVGFLIGRLLVRIFLNLLLGGTLWGGNFL
ncbi:hypothetical protein [Streptococcus suis]|uniref:Uncharacterized protein n=1 Tax=Streptococcus suis TaxID=1307 RepID=A0A0Z8SZL2_STRSU|nr:hypothetical protein [Streptococcus suis]MDE3733914.1 hypothetical protein [Streptococcus suis]MDW8758910.1 hypothetical protein [Streptococcus suis]CYX10033.1 Uncharacterised protein [Streptococcus suis]